LGIGYWVLGCRYKLQITNYKLQVEIVNFTERYKTIIRIAMFAAAAILTAIVVPGEHGFRYDFRIGSPWAYSDLIASSDFPILKSEQQLKQDRDSVINSLKPVYRQDSVAPVFAAESIKRIFRLFNEKNKDHKLYPFYKDSIDDYRHLLLDITEEMYAGGVMLTHSGEASSIIVLQDNVAEERSLSECYTEKTAYDKLKNISERYKNGLYPSVRIDEIVKANLIPDEDLFAKMKEDALSEVSLHEGIVQTGERIIAKGEVVNELKYRMLNSFREQVKNQTVVSVPGALHYLGQFVMFLMFFAVFYIALYIFERKAFESLKQIIYFIGGTLMYAMAAAIIARFDSVSPFMIPILILPVLTVTFFNAQTAILHHTLTVVVVSFILPNSFDFFIIQFISGFAVAAGMMHLRRRGQVLRMTLLVFVLQLILYPALLLVYENSFTKLDSEFILWALVSSAFLPASYPLVYVFERAFGFISEVSLIELADTNRPLLRDLSEKAPGTFQHSMQVANLAEDAVRKIGGNSLLVRAGALYHDIGKMLRPAFFTENQLSGKNPHDAFPPEESAKIIIEHVSQGLHLAEQHHLPAQICEFIVTHHADSTVRWFLHAYKEQHPEQPVDETLFRYSGHKPYTKEAAVVMMADSIEAASRSLKNYDKKTINELVDKLINYQISENLFTDTELTFSELGIVRQAFKDKLVNIYHSRIEYPE